MNDTTAMDGVLDAALRMALAADEHPDDPGARGIASPERGPALRTAEASLLGSEAAVGAHGEGRGGRGDITLGEVPMATTATTHGKRGAHLFVPDAYGLRLVDRGAAASARSKRITFLKRKINELPPITSQQRTALIEMVASLTLLEEAS